MREKVIKISPSGELTFLTHGDEDLLQLGEAKIVRASNVRFSNKAQRWFVWLRFPNGDEHKVSTGFVKRSDAIAEEVRICQPILFLYPEFVDKILKTARE